jgi:hypothetical protein
MCAVRSTTAIYLFPLEDGRWRWEKRRRDNLHCSWNAHDETVLVRHAQWRGLLAARLGGR